MLSNFTWKQFALTVGALTLLYYIFIILKFKGSYLIRRLKQKPEMPSTADPKQETAEEEDYSRFQPQADAQLPIAFEDTDPAFEAASALSIQIKETIATAAAEETATKILHQKLRVLLQNEPVTKLPVYKVALQNLIETELLKNRLPCSAEMIGALWE